MKLVKSYLNEKSYDHDFEKTIDWDHLAEPEDLEEPEVDFDFGDAKLPDLEDEKRIDVINSKLGDLGWEIPDIQREIKDLIKQLKTERMNYENFMSDLSFDVMDILSSGLSDKEKIELLSPGFQQGGNPFKKLGIGSHVNSSNLTKKEADNLISDYYYIIDSIDTFEKQIQEFELSLKEKEEEEQILEKEKEEIYHNASHFVLIDKYEKKLKELQIIRDELDTDDQEEVEILNKRIQGYEWKIRNTEDKASKIVKESYIFFNKKPTQILLEALSDYEEIESAAEELADDALLFYLRINTEFPAIIKVFKTGDIDDRWEMTVVEGDNTALDEMEFDPEFSKMEIISYLTDIYGDIEEVDQEFADEIIDDKKELDDDFYGIDESINFEQGGDPYKKLRVGSYKDIDDDKIILVWTGYYPDSRKIPLKCSKCDGLEFETEYKRQMLGNVYQTEFVCIKCKNEMWVDENRIINESINFEQGGDPYKTLKIGQYSKPRERITPTQQAKDIAQQIENMLSRTAINEDSFWIPVKIWDTYIDTIYVAEIASENSNKTIIQTFKVNCIKINYDREDDYKVERHPDEDKRKLIWETDDDFYGIDESINFEQGGDPYKKLKIGQYSNYEEHIQYDNIGDTVHVKKHMKDIGRIIFIEIISKDSYDINGSGDIEYIDANGVEKRIEYNYDLELKGDDSGGPWNLDYNYFVGTEEYVDITKEIYHENIIDIIFNDIKEKLK